MKKMLVEVMMGKKEMTNLKEAQVQKLMLVRVEETINTSKIMTRLLAYEIIQGFLSITFLL